MADLGEWRVQVGKTKRTREIDRIHDHQRLGAGSFATMSRTRDFAYRPEPGEMQDTLSQEQSSLIEIRLAAY